MRILHYSLGLPPFRSGGLTRVSISLMKEQVKMGNIVFLLWPGENSKHNLIKIKRGNRYCGIFTFRIINPLPVPLMGGVSNVNAFTERCQNPNIYTSFLLNTHPDIIHIHTFMGLHKEFLEAAHKLNIPIIYTTHDYYGLCPRVTLLKTNGEICSVSNRSCDYCINNPVSLKAIRFKQSRIYRAIKILAEELKIKKKQIPNPQIMASKTTSCSNEDYITLAKYYSEMFKKIDFFHFNSSQTQIIFNKFLNSNLPGKVISLVSGLKPNAINESRKESIINLCYLGGPTLEKGFFCLINALDSVTDQNKYRLHIFGFKYSKQYIKSHPKYKFSKTSKVFHKMDLMVVPSLWKETFGLGVVEALDSGIPVLISSNVGSRDIVNKEFGWIYFSQEELLDILNEINKKKISQMAQNIKKKYHSKTIKDFSSEIMEIYQDATKLSIGDYHD